MTKTTNKETAKKQTNSFLQSKPFAVFLFITGILGLLVIAHHIVSYEAVLRPYMDYLIENKVITNDRSGSIFLLFFTNQSNIFVDVYFILYAFGIFGNKKLFDFTHKEEIRGGVTLYILITGIIYCCVLMPFAPSFFPFPNMGKMWFSNVVNTWNHMFIPLLATVLWFFPVNDKPIKKCKTSLYYLIYPIAYFVFSIINGAKINFYPYPFLNGEQLWSYLFKDKPYDSTIGILLLVAVVLIFSLLFFAIGTGLNAIHNKRIKK